MMRLLKRSPGGDINLISVDNNPPPYAILSHTWNHGEEVTYADLVAGAGKDKTGYTKIQFCLDKAAEDGIAHCWVDTCCIDKSSAAELSTAINSMFRYYQRASKCYVYLSDVQVPEEVIDATIYRITWLEAFRRSRWFTRGWTLQELLAPPTVEFFSKEGKRLGSKISLEQEIHEITKLPVEALRGQRRLTEFNIEDRIGWVAKRTTTLVEDKVYCLLGIFGVFLLPNYGEGEDYATFRLREEIERRQQGKGTKRLQDLITYASQSQLKPTSNVPFRKDQDFVDRGDILARIDERCSQPAGRAALVGFGGFGKSQLAIEYAHRFRKRSPDTWIFWVYASNSARVEGAFSEIASRVGLASEANTQADVLPLVRRWLSNVANGNWLLIVDNVDDEVMVEVKDEQKLDLSSLLPQSENGAILFTSRSVDVARRLVGREQDIIKIGAMTDHEATRLLQTKLTNTDLKGADQLVRNLDCIPLAIVQAAAYVNRLGPPMSVMKYLNELTLVERKTQLLHNAARDMRRDEHALNSVLATWQISFEHLRSKRPSAAKLLSFMSFFNRRGIPEFMLRHYLDNETDTQDDSPSQSSEVQKMNFEDDMAMLRAFSLVSMAQWADEFEMHGLVQLATRMWLKSNDTEKRWHRNFIRAMAKEFPNGEYSNWTKCQMLFPHALNEFEQRAVEHQESKDLANLLYYAGWYAWEQGLYTQARDMALQALKIRKKFFRANEIEVLNIIEFLGLILKDLDNYVEAESMIRQALSGNQNLFGCEHNATLLTMSHLAGVLFGRGKHDEAELIYRQTLAGTEKSFGREHPETLMVMNNLALVLSQQGKHDEAEAIYRQALAGKEKLFGREHPSTLTSVYCLAYVLVNQHRYDEAEPLYKRACAGRNAVLGANHPLTRACHQDYDEMLRRRDKFNERKHAQTKGEGLSRSLAKLDIGS